MLIFKGMVVSQATGLFCCDLAGDYDHFAGTIAVWCDWTVYLGKKHH